MRELIEKGFEVNVVSDATAGGDVPDLGDGYESALINFRFIASSVIDTDTAIGGMGESDPSSVVFDATNPGTVEPTGEESGGVTWGSMSVFFSVLASTVSAYLLA